MLRAPWPTSTNLPRRIATDETTLLRSSIVWMRPFSSTRVPRLRRRFAFSLALTTFAVKAPPPVATAAPASALLFRKSLRETPDFRFMAPLLQGWPENIFCALFPSFYIELGRGLTSGAHQFAHDECARGEWAALRRRRSRDAAGLFRRSSRRGASSAPRSRPAAGRGPRRRF